MSANKRSQQNKSQPKFEEEKITTAAFVLCHPIDSTLSPVSKEFPPCLFPLCNIPVLFYNLHWLYNNGVEKIYIVCQNSHEKIIKNYIKQWQEKLTFKSIEILPVSRRNYQINSIGDSIRWLYSSSSIVLHFQNCIIVPGTLVTNAPLKQIVSQHEKRTKKPNKGKGKPILSTIFTQAPKSHDTYSLLLDNEGKILKMDIPSSINFKYDIISEATFQKSKSTTIKTDLKDTQIYVCAPELMETFSSSANFNWNSIMDDCVASIIDLESNFKSVHATILNDSYASHVNDLQSYIDSSLSVIHNALKPLTLDANIATHSTSYSLLFDDQDEDEEEENANENDDDDQPDGQNGEMSEKGQNNESELNSTHFKLTGDFVYFDSDVTVSNEAKIGPTVVIGAHSKIEEGCVIENAVIGADCTIRKGAVIKNSIIWDRATINEGVQIDHSLIASDVSIEKNVKVNFGCILSFNVIVDVDLPPCRRLTGYEIGDGNKEDEIEFRSEKPQWLKNYIKNREPIPPSESNYFEYRPCTDSEIPFLHLWRKISPETFPIDISKIETEMNEAENESGNDDEEEEDF